MVGGWGLVGKGGFGWGLVGFSLGLEGAWLGVGWGGLEGVGCEFVGVSVEWFMKV